MSKAKKKVADLMSEHNISFEQAKAILSEMHIEVKQKTKGLTEEEVNEFEKRLAESLRVGNVIEKDGVQEKVVKPGIKRRVRVVQEAEHEPLKEEVIEILEVLQD